MQAKFVNILIFCFYCSGAANSAEIISSKLLQTCLKLKGISPTSLYVERNNGSETYQNLNYQWNFRHGTITPLAYFLPDCRRDVQIAIRCGSKFGIRIVAKSGGHSYAKYSYGNSHTVIIDLKKMSKVKVDQLALTAEVGAGTLNGRLYWELWNSGKFGISGPTCTTTGVAGVTLGGGFGEWSKQYGLMLDNVISMDFITPDGKFLVLSETRNADLFWAMRGAGGGNFGIVTSFKFKIFQAGSILTNRILIELDANKFKKGFGAFESFAEETLDGPTFFMFIAKQESITILATNTNLTVQNVKSKLAGFGLKAEDVKISTQSLNFIDSVATSAVPSVSSSSKLSLVKHSDYSKRYFRAKSYFVQKVINQAEMGVLEPLFLQIPKGVTTLVDALGGAINRVPSTATAYVHRNSFLSIQVEIETKNEIVDKWVKKFDKILLEVLNVKESYQNYIDEDLKPNEEYLRRYYGENLARLVKIKNVIDPNDYFKFPMSIPLKISN